MEVINRSSELQRYYARREQPTKCKTCGKEVKYFQLANHRKMHKEVQHCDLCNVDVRDIRAHRRGSGHRKVAPKHEQILLDLKARCDSEKDAVGVWIVSRDDARIRRSTRLLSVSELNSEVLDVLLEGRNAATDRKFASNEVEFGLAVFPMSLSEVNEKCDVTLLSDRMLEDGTVQICCNVDAPEGMEPHAVEMMCWWMRERFETGREQVELCVSGPEGRVWTSPSGPACELSSRLVAEFLASLTPVALKSILFFLTVRSTKEVIPNK